METLLAMKICDVCIMRVGEVTQTQLFVVDAYPRPKQATVLMQTDTKQAGSAVFSGGVEILSVFRFGGVTKICKRAIGSIAVYVVNLFWWKFSNHKKEGKPVGKVSPTIKTNAGISIWSPDASDASYDDAPIWFNQPRKQASLRVVMKQLAQTLRGKIGFSHDAPFQRIGQRLACVFSTCGPRHFNLISV